MRPAQVLLVVALAGCVGTGPSGNAHGPFPWRLAGCDEVAMVVPADGAALVHRLPDGFRFLSATEFVAQVGELPFAPPPFPPPGPASVPLAVTARDCASAEILDGAPTSGADGAILAFVVPPEEFRSEGTTSFLLLALLQPDPAKRRALAGLGVESEGGAVVVGETAGALRLGSATYAMEGRPAAPGSKEGQVAIFASTERGLATWNGTFVWNDRANGLGVLHVPASSPFHAALGDAVVGEFARSVFSWPDGRFARPP